MSRPRWLVWLIVLAIVIVVACVPAIWFTTLRIAGVKLAPSSQDPFVFLGTLGGIMGGIFTAGGLVIALASIVVVLTVEDRVQQKFEAQMPQVVEQADQQIEAYLTFLETRWGSGDWTYQLRLAKQAIQQHPRLRYKVRSYMARSLSERVVTTFARQHTNLAVVYSPPPPRENPSPDDALHQIWEAQSSGEDPDGELAALEALMYGANGPSDYAPMMRALRRDYELGDNVLTHVRSELVLAHVRSELRRAILARACGFDRQRLSELGTLLGLVLPVQSEEVIRTIIEIDPRDELNLRPGIGPHVDWIVVGKLGAPFSMRWTDWPKAIRIFKIEDAAGTTLYKMQSLPVNADDQHMTALERIEAQTPADIIARLETEFLFICKDTTRWAFDTPHQSQTAV